MNTTTLTTMLAAKTVSALPSVLRAEHLNKERLIRLPEVLDMVGLGKTTIYAMVKDREFPQPRKVRGLSVWVESEVQKWIKDLANAEPEAQQGE